MRPWIAGILAATLAFSSSSAKAGDEPPTRANVTTHAIVTGVLLVGGAWALVAASDGSRYSDTVDDGLDRAMMYAFGASLVISGVAEGIVTTVKWVKWSASTALIDGRPGVVVSAVW